MMRMKSPKLHTIRAMALIILTAFLLPSLSTVTEAADPHVHEAQKIPLRSIQAQPQGLKYAIITNTELSEEFLDLALWRSMRGTRAEIFLIDGQGSILEGQQGRDDAEKLFNAITEIYDDSGGSLEYLLLGGDSEIVPTRYLWANASRWGYDDSYLSDVYFSSPGTDWDMDRDGRYGERDDMESFGIDNLSFPIKVGRFPVSDRTEAERMVRRVIDYETSPPPGDWLKRGIISSSLMERPNWPNDPETPEDEGFDPYKDNAYKAFSNYTKRFIPISLDIIEAHDYQEYFGGKYNLSVDGLDDSTLRDLLDQGSSFMTFAGQSFYDIDFGHSPPIAYSLAHYRVNSGNVSGAAGFGLALTYEDTANLTNGGKLPVVYISSCDSANFSSPGDTSLENIVHAENGGAICMIGSTGVSWRGEGENYSLGNWYLTSQFWKKMMGDQRPGDALYANKQEYIDQKWDEFATKEVLLIELYTYNLLGDPALTSWIGTPAELSSTIDAEENHYAGGDILSVRLTNAIGVPVANADIAIRSNDTGKVFTAASGPDGWAHIETRFSSGGNATILAHSKNYIPVASSITILDAPLDLQVDASSVAVAPMPLSETRTATLNFTVKNIGGRDSEGTSVGIYIGELDVDPDKWPGPVVSEVFDIEQGSSKQFQFEMQPMRSWDVISIGVNSDQVEINLVNNIASIQLDVNARPRFLPSELLVMQEDQQGGGLFNISQMVFDPDDEETDLLYTLGTGSPPWCSMNGHILDVRPPGNWSGTFGVTVRVSDGLATDLSELDIFVEPMNDAPVVTGIQPNYTVTVDRPFLITYNAMDLEGDAVSVDIETDLARLKILGETIRMVPYPEDRGIHEVKMIFSDGNGGFTNITFELNIIDNSEDLYFSHPSIHMKDAVAGEDYSYRIEVDGDLSTNATYQDDSPLFQIDPSTGWIRFKPDGDDAGDHWVRITVTSGNTSIERTFLLKISKAEDGVPVIWYILGVIAVVLLIAVAGVVLWRGPGVVQYGLEE